MPLAELVEVPVGTQWAFPLGSSAQPPIFFSNALSRPTATPSGVYGTIAPLSGFAGPGIGVSILASPVLEVDGGGVTIVPSRLSVAGLKYSWPSAAGTAGSVLTTDGGTVSPNLSWSSPSGTFEGIDGRNVQYFTDPFVRRLLEEILLVMRTNAIHNLLNIPSTAPDADAVLS